VVRCQCGHCHTLKKVFKRFRTLRGFSATDKYLVDDDVTDDGDDDDDDDDGGTVAASLSPVAASISQPVQPLTMIHYDVSGHPLFTQPSPPNLTSLVNYGHFTGPGRTTVPTPKLRPPPSFDGSATGTADGDAAISGTSLKPSLPGAVLDDTDDEKMGSVMNAIRPMHPAYCVPASQEAYYEMNVIRPTVVGNNRDENATSNL